MTTMFEGDTTTATEPSELDTFKALVRRKARAAKRQQGWDTAKMNGVLIELGLEPVPTYAIEVPFTASGVYRYEVVDGTTEAQAEEIRERVQAYPDAEISGSVRSRDMAMVERGEAKRVITGVDGATTAEEAKTTDLAAYKRYVRKVSIRVAKENGWCDSGLNDYLGQMGLPLKQNHYVMIEVPVTQRVAVAVGEAESAEEARELLLSGGEDAERIIRDHLGTSVQLNGKPTPVDIEAVRRGDRPDPTYDPSYGFIADRGAGQCRSTDRATSAYCTRQRGHTGQHIAGNGTTVIAVWPQR